MKRLAITMGDPGGVGPEVIVKALEFSGDRKYLYADSYWRPIDNRRNLELA